MLKIEQIGKLNKMSLTRRTTTIGCKRCRSIQLIASLVLTTRVLREDRIIKDPSQKQKGQLTSPTLSATAVVRKATIRTNVTPRSSVINYKELDIARMDSILLRVGLTPRVIGMPRS